MTNEEIRELIQLVTDTGVAELEVQRGDDRVRIRRAVATHEITIPAAPAAPHLNQTSGPAPVAAAQVSSAAPVPASANEVIVKSPIVGTFYESHERDRIRGGRYDCRQAHGKRPAGGVRRSAVRHPAALICSKKSSSPIAARSPCASYAPARSEERRVGKE